MESGIDSPSVKPAVIPTDNDDIRVISMLGHELRTALNAIIGTSQIIQTSTKLSPEELKDWLKQIQHSAFDMARILDDLLDYTRLLQGQITLDIRGVDFGQLLANIARGFIPKAKEKNIELKINIAPTATQVVYGDPQRIGQILHNLLDNALKFTEQGEIQVNVSNGIDPRTQSPCLQVMVADTGIGIEPHQLSKVFDQFTQAYGTEIYHKAYQGLGLGLTLVKKLVDLQNGTIKVQSQYGYGTQVSFTLPTTAVNRPVETSILNNLRILIVDSNSQRGQSLSQQLTAAGLNAQKTTLNEAVYVMQTALKQKEHYDIVIVVAENLAQHEAYFARTLRTNAQFQQTLLMLVLPTEHQAYAEEQALINGFNGVLKTTQPALLLETLATTWNTWLQKGEGDMAMTPTMATKKVLVVEDNLINQKVAKLMLTELGCDVQIAPNGKSALRVLTKEKFEIVFMDIGLPDINGLDVISQIRQQEHGDQQQIRVPIIVVTADGTLDDKELLQSKGVDAYLIKPLDLSQLREVIERVMR